MIGYSVGYPQSSIRVPRLATTPPWRRTRAPTLAPGPDHGDHPDGRQQRRHHLHHRPADRDAADGHLVPEHSGRRRQCLDLGRRRDGALHRHKLVHDPQQHPLQLPEQQRMRDREPSCNPGQHPSACRIGRQPDCGAGGGRLDHPLDRHGNRPSTRWRQCVRHLHADRGHVASEAGRGVKDDEGDAARGAVIRGWITHRGPQR